MWLYEQISGRLSRADKLLASGYSGFSEGKNNPARQSEANVGPIPEGAYWIGPEREETADHGPVVLPLVPVPGTNTFGRSGFLIHGDSIEHPGAASHGCIILPRPVRELIASNSQGVGDRLLIVISGA